MRITLFSLRCTMLCLAACLCLSVQTVAAPLEISFAINARPHSALFTAAARTVERVNARLAELSSEALGPLYESATLTLEPLNALGPDTVIMQSLMLGQTHLALIGWNMSRYVSEAGFFDLPFIVRDRAHVQALEKSVVWPLLAPVMLERGITLLGFWERGFHYLANNVRPIRTPHDLQGLRVRVPDLPTVRDAWTILKVVPVTLPMGDIYRAARQGVIDGHTNSLAGMRTHRTQEVQRFLSSTPSIFVPAYLVASTPHWNKLPERVRTVIQEEARAVSEDMLAWAEEQDLEHSDAFNAANVRLDPMDVPAFTTLTAPLRERFARQSVTSAAMLKAAGL